MCGVSQSGWYMLSCWHMTFIWYIQKYVSYAWKRKVCYFGGWFMCCVSRRPWEQPGQASCLGYRYLDIWPLERTCVDDDGDDDDDHDDDDDDGDDGEDNNDDGSSVCKALSQQEPQVNEALLCRVCSAKCKVQSAKWKVDAELLHCFIIAMNVMIMFKMINSYWWDSTDRKKNKCRE